MQVFSERGCKYGTLETVCPGVDRKGVKIEEAKWMDIRSDRQKGLSYTEIGRKYNIDPRTAKRYAQAETRPVYSLSEPKPSKLDPYKEQIAVWLEEAPYSCLLYTSRTVWLFSNCVKQFIGRSFVTDFNITDMLVCNTDHLGKSFLSYRTSASGQLYSLSNISIKLIVHGNHLK